MKKWEIPSVQYLNICCTQTKAINLFCGGEVNIEENNKIKCMDWTKGNQKFEEICIHAKDKKSGLLIWQMSSKPNNGNAYCGNYTYEIDPDGGISG